MEIVETFEQLFKLAEQKRAVKLPGASGAIRPAAFIIQMPAAYIKNLISAGLCVYEKQEKKQDE
jgi:hypothetical protein